MGNRSSALDASKGYFNGLIDEVVIYNTALTAAEISAHYNGGSGVTLTGTETGLVGYWPFYEGSGTTTADRTANANNGTLVNGVAWVNAAGSVPGSADTVTFDANSGGTTTIGTSPTVSAMTLAAGYAGTVTQAAAQTFAVSNDFTVAAGIFNDTSGGTITVNGAFTQSGGNFTAPSTGSFSVAGNFVISGGTFNHNSGTVTLNGASQTITGSTTFYNLTKSVGSAATLSFAAGSTTTINGTLTLNGAAGQLLSLRSGTAGTQWNLALNTGAVKNIGYVDVKDGNASASAATFKPIIPANSINSGNNIDWFAAPAITVAKTSTVISDPVNNTTNPKRIASSVTEFSLTITNSGTASPDASTVYITDPIDKTTMAFDVNSGVTFTNGATSSGLALGAVSYSSTAAPGPYVYTYTPVPDANGYDGNITSIKVTTTGTFAYAGTPSPGFTLKFRTMVK